MYENPSGTYQFCVFSPGWFPLYLDNAGNFSLYFAWFTFIFPLPLIFSSFSSKLHINFTGMFIILKGRTFQSVSQLLLKKYFFMYHFCDLCIRVLKKYIFFNFAFSGLSQACRALVISGSEEGKIMFWDVEQGSPVAIIQAHAGPCNCLFVWSSHFLSGGG